MDEIISELEEIRYNVGDIMDREGNYISDQISSIIRKIKEQN
jgi:hypothetical protein